MTEDLVTFHLGDCIEIMRTLPDASVDAVVTDPPYGLEFMGKDWDGADGFRRSLNSADVGRESVFGRASRTSPEYRAGELFGQWCVEWARECLRVLKPGAHILAFGGSRTWHRLAVAIEDSGFEIRDSIAWLYGSGFPKSLDVSKAIDKTAGHWRGRAGEQASANGSMSGANYERTDKGDPVTAAAAAWAGWGTALKPAFEPIVMGRKPIAGTVAQNVLAHGTGALNIDACRIAGDNPSAARRQGAVGHLQHGETAAESEVAGRIRSRTGVERYREERPGEHLGRWPANVVLDESQAAELDRRSGVTQSRVGVPTERRGGDATNFAMTRGGTTGYDDMGGASRFFYVAKAGSAERPKLDGQGHPTVKPLGLMRWLIRLITPPGGTVLEPFLGSGTTAEACVIEGFRCIAIERDPHYMDLAKSRFAKPIAPVLDFGVMTP